MQTFRLDTTEVPNDKTTRMILELRELKGGFNIREAIVFKLEEDRQKGDLARPEVEKFAAFIQDGEGKRRLDNAITWIYRRHFT